MTEPLPLPRLRLTQALAGENLAELARRIHKDRTTLSNYRLGRREPDMQTLACICRELGVSADWVLGISDERRPMRLWSSIVAL